MIFTKIREVAWRHYKHLEREEHKLRYLFLELSRKCNLSCRHCGSDCSSDSSMAEMTPETWMQIIDYMMERYNPFFVLTGGEPLVYNGFDKVINHLKKRKASWGMVTNGMELSEEVMNALLRNGLQSITLSLDGDEESHLYIRRHKESWDRALTALDVMGSSSVKTMDVVTCVYPGNIEKLEETAELLIEKKIPAWRLFRIFPKGAAAHNEKLLLSYEESLKMVEWIQKNRKKYLRRGLDISFSCEGYLPFKTDRKVRREPYFCRAGISIASILSDGTITGCNNNGPDFYQGNLSKDDFSVVWEKRFKEYRDPSWKKTGLCSECKEWKNCEGGSVHLREKSCEDPLFCYIHKKNK